MFFVRFLFGRERSLARLGRPIGGRMPLDDAWGTARVAHRYGRGTHHCDALPSGGFDGCYCLSRRLHRAVYARSGDRRRANRLTDYVVAGVGGDRAALSNADPRARRTRRPRARAPYDAHESPRFQRRPRGGNGDRRDHRRRRGAVGPRTAPAGRDGDSKHLNGITAVAQTSGTSTE